MTEIYTSPNIQINLDYARIGDEYSKKIASIIINFFEIISTNSPKDISDKIEDSVFLQSIPPSIPDEYFDQFKRKLLKELYDRVKNVTHLNGYEYYVKNIEKIFENLRDNNKFDKLKEAIDALEKQAASKAFRKILASPRTQNKFSSVKHIPDKHFGQFVNEMWRVMTHSVESQQDDNSIFEINENDFFLILERLDDENKKMSLTLLYVIHNYASYKENELREKFNSEPLQSILKKINHQFGEKIKSVLPNHQIKNCDPFSVIKEFAKYYHEYEHIKACDLDKRTPALIQQQLKLFLVKLDTNHLNGLSKGATYWQQEKVKQIIEDPYRPSLFKALTDSQQGYSCQNNSWFCRKPQIEKNSQLCKFYGSLLNHSSRMHKLAIKHKAIIAYALLSQPKSDFHNNVLHNLRNLKFGSSEPTLQQAKEYFKQIVIDLYEIDESTPDGKIKLERIEERVKKINRLAENKEWRWNLLFSNPASEITKEFFERIDKPTKKENVNTFWSHVSFLR